MVFSTSQKLCYPKTIKFIKFTALSNSMLKRIFALIVILTICSSNVFSSEINSLRLARIWTDSNIYSPNEKIRINAEIENVGGSSFFVSELIATAYLIDSDGYVIDKFITSHMGSLTEIYEIKVGERKKFYAYSTWHYKDGNWIDFSISKVGQYTIKVVKIELQSFSRSEGEFVTLGYITPTKNNEVTISVVPEIEKQRLIIEQSKLDKMREQLELLNVQVNNSRTQINLLQEQVNSSKKQISLLEKQLKAIKASSAEASFLSKIAIGVSILGIIANIANWYLNYRKRKT
jgi:hypothetical protein